MTDQIEYAGRKTLGNGFLDFALLMANASLLKAMVYVSPANRNGYYAPTIIFIGLSLLLQAMVGILLIILGFSELKISKTMNKTNHAASCLIFFIFVLNIISLILGVQFIDGAAELRLNNQN